MRIVALLIFVLLLISPTLLSAQGNNLGRLPIKNFSKDIYKAGSQTWQISQGQNGLMYFANNDGLLTYDGTNWQLYPIDNNTIVRSLFIAEDGKIFVGGQGELGYFFPNDLGQLEYNSLIDLIPEEKKNFADVWRIQSHKGRLFFQTGANIFIYEKGNQMLSLETGGIIEFSGIFKNEFYIKDNYRGILKLEDNAFVITPDTKVASPLTSFLPFNDQQVLVTSLKDGIFLFDGTSLTPWPTDYDDFLKEKRIYCATKLEDGHLALGTALGGLLIIDQKGKAVNYIQKSSGLQNANVLSLHRDWNNNIWLGLNNSIDYLEYESPFTYIYPDSELEGTGYTAALKDGKIYFGTSNGLYQANWDTIYKPFDDQLFQLVPGTAGQTWGLSTLGNQLVLNSHEGAFQIEQGRARRLTKNSTWKHLLINDQLAICGGYNGFSLFKKEGEQWNFQKKLNGFEESSRILIKEKSGNIWVSHPYRGVYKVQLKTETDSIIVRYYTSKNGLPSDLLNYVYSINNKALFATKQGIYQYLEDKDRFAPYPILNDYLGKTNWVKSLSQGQSENIWFVTDQGVGCLDIKEDGLQKRISKKMIPGLDERLVGGFEYIYPYNDQNVFFGAQKGFIHYDAKKAGKTTFQPKVLINKIELPENDSLFFGGYFTQADTVSFKQGEVIPKFKAHHNAFHFSFSSPSYSTNADVQYQTMMSGMGKEWTIWSKRTEKEYNNLNPGKYVFMVRARNADGHISEPTSYAFEIKAPWYASTLAFIIYCLVGIGIIAGIMYLQRNKYETEKEQLKTIHEEKEKQQQQKVEQTESELNQLRNEQLEKELQFQKKELASATMHIMQKSEMISNIREQLSKAVQKNAAPEQIKKEVDKIVRMLQQDSILDDSWEQFTLHFDQVHSDFLKNLRERYPKLTNYDQKICAYLRMNLSTKEIATLMNISIRGVEGSRYRLRKKLDIPKEKNLVKFIQSI